MNSREPVTGSQPFLSYRALQRALSPERLAAYADLTDVDELDGMARYLWNGALAAALVPALHALEVTLRNNFFTASRQVVNEEGLKFSEVRCWLDAKPSLLYEKEAVNVEQAKELIRRGGRPLTAGRLISRLSFGFWVALCRSPYEQGRPSGPGLWPALTLRAFPFLPKEHRSRTRIFARLDELRELRNRVFHHDPIWDRDMERAHSRIIDTISWMNHGVARAAAELSTVASVSTEGPESFRARAESLVRL